MRYLKIILLFFVIAVLLIFVVQNVGQLITLKFFNTKIVETEMVIVMMIAFLIGLLVGFLIAGIQILSASNKVRELRSEYKKLRQEVDSLRNKDLEESEDN